MKKILLSLIVPAMFISAGGFMRAYGAMPARDTLGMPEPEYIMMAEQMPSFNGGDLGTFREWVAEQVYYPVELLRERVGGTVVVSFIVNTDGNLSHIKELASSPKKNGVPSRLRFTLPIKFMLQ